MASTHPHKLQHHCVVCHLRIRTTVPDHAETSDTHFAEQLGASEHVRTHTCESTARPRETLYPESLSFLVRHWYASIARAARGALATVRQEWRGVIGSSTALSLAHVVGPAASRQSHSVVSRMVMLNDDEYVPMCTVVQISSASTQSIICSCVRVNWTLDLENAVHTIIN